MSDLFLLLTLTGIGSVLGLIGGVIFLFNKKLSKILEVNAIAFAAGVLLTVAIVGLMAESAEILDHNAFYIVLASFMSVFIFEKFLFGIHHHDNHKHEKHISQSVPFVIIGDTVHNFIDGIAIGASFAVSPGLGLVTAISSFLHEVPHEIGDFGIMLRAKWEKKNILLVNLFSAMASIIGALLVFYVDVGEEFVGVVLAISAGIFLYLGAIDFLPHVLEKKKNNGQSMVALILGILVMLAIFVFIPHE